MITWENYDEYIMMHADGELAPAEMQALMEFIAQHPALAKELAAYEMARLSPDETQVYAAKQSLLKPLPATKKMALPIWRRYGVAAGIAALICASIFWFASKDKQPAELEKTDTITQHAGQHNTPVAVADNQIRHADSNLASPPDTVMRKPGRYVYTKIAATRKNTSRHVAVKAVQHKQQSDEIIAELPLAETRQTATATGMQVITAVKDVPAFASTNSEKEAKRSFWDMLPVDELKKAQMSNFAGAVADLYDEITTTRSSIYNKTITVKVEKRKLIISF